MDFADKRILVTGSGRGIGKAAARAFLERGARVAINDKTDDLVKTAIEELGGGNDLVAAPGDVSTAAGCKGLVSTVLRSFGGLDVLVNSAGVVRLGPAETFDETEWDRIVDTNLKGVFFTTIAALPTLRESKGNVVNLASESGLIGNPFCVVYCASKGGVVLMSRALALEMAPDVRVNCVCPGTVDTEMGREIAEASGDAEAYMQQQYDYYPMKRVASPEEIATGILYLASSDAAFITGTTLSIDGGITAGH